MPDWFLANARLTFFVIPEAQIVSTLWQDTLGEEPENSAFQRASLTRTANGPFAEGRLDLLTQPMRVDWVYQGAESEGNSPPMLGTFPAAADPILDIGRRCQAGGSFPSTYRIALGFVLISPTPDRDTGYRELKEYIDGVPDAPDAADFQYQVNRPRPSGAIAGLLVNRLSKWSVGGYRMVAVSLGEARNPMVTPLQYHLRLELDINTAADFQGLIPRDRIQGVIEDLFRGAQEIYERGNHF